LLAWKTQDAHSSHKCAQDEEGKCDPSMVPVSRYAHSQVVLGSDLRTVNKQKKLLMYAPY